VQIAGDEALASMIAEVQEQAAAAGRGPVDIAWNYSGEGLRDAPAADADRHRTALGQLEAIGVTTVLVTTPARSAAATLEFVDAFGATYLP
jgi:hypothetical protein